MIFFINVRNFKPVFLEQNLGVLIKFKLLQKGKNFFH